MLDETRGIYVDNGGVVIQLSQKETRLLYFLIRHKNRLVKYEEIATFIGWAIYDRCVHNSLMVLMFKVRAKLNNTHVWIKNVTKLGYIIEYKK